MNHLDLFSGIGGFALAASKVWGVEHNIVSFCEIDAFCQKVLKKHWPDVPIISDIKEYKHDGTNIDLLTGGFPCQPFSCAGKQGGTKDDRFLWPEMLRVIREIRPTWIIGENVAGIINMELDRVLSDLEGAAYEVQAFLIPACGVDAPHRRDRVWIVANRNGAGSGTSTGRTDGYWQKKNQGWKELSLFGDSRQDRHAPDTETGKSWQLPESKGREDTCRGSWEEPWLEVATRLCRVDDGISRRVDRLKSLGNAIVPQCVIPIMQAIKEIECLTSQQNSAR